MKRLTSIENDKVQLEVVECDCGYHLGLDATYLEQVEDLVVACPNCKAEIDTSEVFPADEPTFNTKTELTFKAKMELDVMFVMDHDGSNPRIVVNAQEIPIVERVADMDDPKDWCEAEDDYVIRQGDTFITLTCGAIRKAKKLATTH